MNGCSTDYLVMSLERLLGKAFRLFQANSGLPVVAASAVVRNCGLDTLMCLGAK